MKTAIWTAPSLGALNHSNVRLDCAPETIRALWRAQTKQDVLRVLTAHYCDLGVVPADGAADDLFCVLQMEGQHLLPLHAVKRRLVNHLGGFHGVESLGTHRRNGKTVWYCNAGDTYAPTLCFNGRRLFVACWGDLIESRTVVPFRQF